MIYGNLCAEFYDIDKQFAEPDEVDFYKQFLDKNRLILEPMCGSGRLLIPLMKAGYQVHGVDNSKSMLENCRKRAATFKLNPVLFEASIETMKLSSQYHDILIPAGSFQLFYPRSSAFNALLNLKNHLFSGGNLILDLFVPWDALYEKNAEEFAEKEVHTPEGETIKHQSHNQANKYEQYYYCDDYFNWIDFPLIDVDGKKTIYLCQGLEVAGIADKLIAGVLYANHFGKITFSKSEWDSFNYKCGQATPNQHWSGVL